MPVGKRCDKTDSFYALTPPDAREPCKLDPGHDGVCSWHPAFGKPPVDAQHKAAIEAAMWAYEGETGHRDEDGMRAAIAAYDAARSGERESALDAGVHHGDDIADLWRPEVLGRAARSGEAEGDARKALILLATARESILVSDDEEVIDAVIDWGYEQKLLLSRSIAYDEVEADLTEAGMEFIRAALAEHPEPRRYSAEPEGREAVSGADLAQAIDGVPHEPRQDQPVDRVRNLDAATPIDGRQTQQGGDDEATHTRRMGDDQRSAGAVGSVDRRRDAAQAGRERSAGATSPERDPSDGAGKDVADQPVNRASGEADPPEGTCPTSGCVGCRDHGGGCAGKQGELIEHPETGEREAIERFAVIEKLAGFLADPSDDRACDCHGEGLDYEGEEWTLCECVLRRIGDLPPLQDGGERLKNLRPEDRALCEIIDDVHERNVGGQHQSGFCGSCANFYTVASRAIALRHPHQDVEPEDVERQYMAIADLAVRRGAEVERLREHLRAIVDLLPAEETALTDAVRDVALSALAPSPADRGAQR